MSSKVPKMVKKFGRAHDKLSRKLNLPGFKYFLLQHDGLTENFTELMVLDKTHHEYSAWRRQMKIKTARLDSTFRINLYKASAVAIGTGPYDIFIIEKEDVVAPDGHRPWWEYFVTRTGEVYTPAP